MRPHTQYRLGCAMIPLALALIAAGITDGLWWALAVGLLSLPNALITLRRLRRQGIGWHGPKTFRELRELRELQPKRVRDTDA